MASRLAATAQAVKSARAQRKNPAPVALSPSPRDPPPGPLGAAAVVLAPLGQLSTRPAMAQLAIPRISRKGKVVG
ncbi:hypothetical protein D3C79_865470 [compost metagenome]